jgi:DNA-binding response OmpR family regulator
MRPLALILEDDPACADVLASVAREEGYRTQCVHRLADARAILAATDVAVLLLDLALGDERGRDLLEALAAVRDPSSTPPTIVVSGSREAGVVAREYAVPLVGKPFDVDEIASAIYVAREFRARPRRSGGR